MKKFQTIRGKLPSHLFLWLLLVMSTNVFGQQSSITISGNITETGSGIPIAGA